MRNFNKIIIDRINNGFIVTVMRPVKNEPQFLFGGQSFEETTNAFHSLHEVSNFLGNIAEQERLSK